MQSEEAPATWQTTLSAQQPPPWPVQQPQPWPVQQSSRGDVGMKILHVCTFVALIANLVLTIYLFRVVHGVVGAAQDLADLFGG
jgi:hypothetical protein